MIICFMVKPVLKRHGIVLSVAQQNVVFTSFIPLVGVVHQQV
jgi:hypothetical protein